MSLLGHSTAFATELHAAQLFRKDVAALANAACVGPIRTTFTYPVFYIAVVVAKKEMVRIYASAIVAMMQYVLILWYRPAVEKPCHPMRLHGGLRSGSETSIPSRQHTAYPKPAPAHGFGDELVFETRHKCSCVIVILPALLIHPEIGASHTAKTLISACWHNDAAAPFAAAPRFELRRRQRHCSVSHSYDRIIVRAVSAISSKERR